MQKSDLSHISLPVSFIDAVSGVASIEDVLTIAARALPGLISSEFAVVTFLDEDKQISRVFQVNGVTDVFGPDTHIYPRTFGAKVLKTGKPQFLGETELAGAKKGLMPRMYAEGVRSVLIAPMLSGTTTVGALSIASKSDAGFNTEQAIFLIAVGKWIASQARLMQQARRTARLAETDALTGLANRTRLIRVLDGPGSLHQPDSKGRVVGVLHIDLDHFKEVNDTLGHAMGDAILRHAAQAMQSATGPTDLVARIGGDEFVVVTRTDPKGREIATLAQKISTAISRPLRVGDVEANVDASIGTALATHKDRCAERLIGNADIALYEVKRNGRSGIQAFSKDMRAKSEKRARLLSDLQAAVDARKFIPFFQPQVSLQTGVFSGFEMLARWPHPELGLVDPRDFIELASVAGLSEEIDAIVRTKGLAALRKLRNDGWDIPKMSFNASAKTLNDPDLLGDLMWEVLAQGLNPEDLVIEVRQAALATADGATAMSNINALSDAGFEVQLDDFGTGYSALSSISELSISAIKLRGDMIASLPHKRNETILSAVIALAQELNYKVIAKDVETASQYSALRWLGCDNAQGYGVCPPVPLDGLIAFMTGYGCKPVELASACS